MPYIIVAYLTPKEFVLLAPSCILYTPTPPPAVELLIPTLTVASHHCPPVVVLQHHQLTPLLPWETQVAHEEWEW